MNREEIKQMMIGTESALEDYLIQLNLSAPAINRIFDKIGIVEKCAIVLGRVAGQERKHVVVVEATEKDYDKAHARAEKWQREYTNLKKRYDRMCLSYDKVREEVSKKNKEIEHLKRVLERLGN